MSLPTKTEPKPKPKPKTYTYTLPPTTLIPNSPLPLIYYPSFFPSTAEPSSSSLSSQNPQPSQSSQSQSSPSPSFQNPHSSLLHRAFSLLTTNTWPPHWIYRYGPTQPSHYHSTTHECMVVLCGRATIRFGVADGEFESEGEGEGQSSLLISAGGGGNGVDAGAGVDASAGAGKEKEKEEFKGIEIPASAGDVFIIPAGVAHKTFNTTPPTLGGMKLLSPGDGHGAFGSFGRDDNDAAVNDQSSGATRTAEMLVTTATELDGFCMMGAYPVGSEGWNFVTGLEEVEGDGNMEEGNGDKDGDVDDNEDRERERERRETIWGIRRPERDPILGVDKGGICGLWM